MAPLKNVDTMMSLVGVILIVLATTLHGAVEPSRTCDAAVAADRCDRDARKESTIDQKWVLSEEARKRLFTEARSAKLFLPEDVPESTLADMFELWKFGPTSANSLPARVLVLRSAESRRRLLPALAEGNRPKAASAPLIAIFGYDSTFYRHIARLNPAMEPYGARLASGEIGATEVGKFSAALQAGYFMLAARAVGLDVGPIGGFDAAAVDADFFAQNPNRASWRSTLVICLGFANKSAVTPRLARFDFDDVHEVL